MFGAEGERLERQRLAARSQYAADLQRQIDEANNRRDAPGLRDSAANHILGFGDGNVQRAPPVQSARSEVPPSSRQYQHQQQLLPEQATFIPRVSNVEQPRQFAYPESARGPNEQKLALQVKEISNTLDRIITVDIPMRIKPQEEAISSLWSKVDQIGTQNRDTVQSLREKVTELSFSVNTLTQKTGDQQDRFRSSITELKNDTSRTRDNCESLSTRVGQIDTRLAQVEDLLRGLITKQQQLEQNMNDQYSQMSTALSTVQKNVNTSSKHLMGQIELVNRETISTFAKVGETIQSSNVAINETIASLARDVKDSFAIVRSECDDEINALKQQLESTAQEVNQSFTALQGEVVQTFSTFKNLLESDVGTLEQCFAQEVSTRRDNDQKLVESQKAMLAGINSQITALVGDIDRTEQAIQPRIEATCNAYFEKWKGELGSYMKDSLDSIQECKLSVDNNILKVADLNMHQKELENRIREVSAKLENQASSFQTQLGAVSLEMGRSIQTKVDDVRKEMSFQNSETQLTIKRQEESFEPRVARLERRTQKFKRETVKAIERRVELLEGDKGLGDYTLRVEKLESIVGSDAIPPQLQKIHAKITKTRQRIDTLPSHNDLRSRVDRLEHSSTKTSSMLERIVRLETIQDMLRQQPAPVAQPTVSFDPRLSSHRPRSQPSSVKEEEIAPPVEEVKPHVWSDEEPEPQEPEVDNKAMNIVFDNCTDEVGIPIIDTTVPNDAPDEESLHECKPHAVFEEMPTNYGIPEVQLIEDPPQPAATTVPESAPVKRHPLPKLVIPPRAVFDETRKPLYISPNGYVLEEVYTGVIRGGKTAPGNFILQIGQPRIVKKPGKRLLLPRKIDEFIYPPTTMVAVEPKPSDAFGNALVGQTEAESNIVGFKPKVGKC